MHEEGCACEECLDIIAAGFIQLGSLRWSPRMDIPDEKSEYWDVFLSRQELEAKYP